MRIIKDSTYIANLETIVDYIAQDSISKGYMIPYLIDKENEKIVILEIFKWSDR